MLYLYLHITYVVSGDLKHVDIRALLFQLYKLDFQKVAKLVIIKVKTLNDVALHVHTSELRDITCHMGSHSVTCHPTQVNAPRLTPAKEAGFSLTLAFLNIHPYVHPSTKSFSNFYEILYVDRC